VRNTGLGLQEGYIFSALASEPEIDLEERAAEYLDQARAVGGALTYLSFRGSSKRAYDSVSSQTYSTGALDNVLAAIAQRMAGRK
jgi:hypothetical protein